LAWAKEHSNMSSKDWENVVWSNEAYVVLGKNKGWIWVTRRPGKELLNDCCIPKLTQSSVCCMIWGCIMKGARGPLVILEYPGGKGGGFNAECYREQALDGTLLKFHDLMIQDRPNFIFQQDGVPAHRAKSTVKWFCEHGIPLFPHPPSPPDLNPIKPLWDVVKKHIGDLQTQPSTYDELCNVILEVWENLDFDEFDVFIDCMLQVVQAIIEANGGHTQY
ncbi:hypothetical protein BT96DRAFT_840396, partial [Gymnopus androsaceus JB14]